MGAKPSLPTEPRQAMPGANHYCPDLSGGMILRGTDIVRSPLEAMQRFIELSDAELHMSSTPVCIDAADDLRTGPLAEYMAKILERLARSRQDLMQKTAVMSAAAEAFQEKAMAMHRALLRAAQSDDLRAALGQSLQSADALTLLAGHLRNCRKHAQNAAMYLELRGGELPELVPPAQLEGGAVSMGEDVQQASRYAECAPSLEKLPSARWFVKAVANHLRSLVVARLALLEAAAALGAAKSEALRSRERLADALKVSSEATEKVDWLQLEEQVEALEQCMAGVSELQQSMIRDQSQAVPDDACITHEDETIAQHIAMPEAWPLLASLSRASAEARDVPRDALVVLAKKLADVAEDRATPDCGCDLAAPASAPVSKHSEDFAKLEAMLEAAARP